MIYLNYESTRTLVIEYAEPVNPRRVPRHVVVHIHRGAATDSGPPGQHIHSGPPAFRGGGYGWGY